MCTVSMIAQDWSDRHLSQLNQYRNDNYPIEHISRQEFNALKSELEALKELLLAAKRYDHATGVGDCEDPGKVELFRRLAHIVGINLSDLFTTQPQTPEVAA